MKSTSLVSAIIPIYNAEKYLKESIQSILNQSYGLIEILAIDDGSTDQSSEIVKSFGDRLKYIYQDNQGAGAAINTGIEHSKGDFIGVLGADDLWVKEKTEKQIEIFINKPYLDVVFCGAINFISPELPKEFRNSRQFPDGPLPGLSAGGMLIKRKSFLRVGYFDTQWKLGEFIDWYLKAQEIGLKAHQLEDVLYHRRVHESNLTVREESNKSDYIRILKASLDRRKKKNGEK